MRTLLVLFLFLPALAAAQTRGIGVSPSVLELRQSVEGPARAVLTVHNLSEHQEWFEVTSEGVETQVLVTPRSFALEAGAAQELTVAVDLKGEREASGFLRVAATRVSPQGFTTGTGFKVPLSVSSNAGLGAFAAAPLEGLLGKFRVHWLLAVLLGGALAFAAGSRVLEKRTRSRRGVLRPGETVVFQKT